MFFKESNTFCLCVHTAGLACRHTADPHPFHMAADAKHGPPPPRAGSGARVTHGSPDTRRPTSVWLEVSSLWRDSSCVFLLGLKAQLQVRSDVAMKWRVFRIQKVECTPSFRKGVVMETNTRASASRTPVWAATQSPKATTRGPLTPGPNRERGQRLDTPRAKPGIFWGPSINCAFSGLMPGSVLPFVQRHWIDLLTSLSVFPKRNISSSSVP